MSPSPIADSQPKSHVLIVGFVAALLMAFVVTDIVLAEFFRSGPYFFDAVMVVVVIAGTLHLRFRHEPTSWLVVTGWFVGLTAAAAGLRIIAFAADFFLRIAYCGITGCQVL